MSSSDPANNLLFAYLALQNGLLERDHFILAVNEWLQDKSRPIAVIVQDREWLDQLACTVIEQLMEVHLRSHDGNAEESIVAIRASLPADPEIENLSLQIIAHDGQTILPDSRPGSIKSDQDDLPDPVPQATVPPSDAPGGSARPSSRPLEEHYSTLHTDGDSIFGRFRILRPHARGGLGQVLIAHDGELNREVAVKELLDRHIDNENLVARFRMEAEITGLLEHPGVVPVYSAGDYPNGNPYYVMRLIRGHELGEEIREFFDKHPDSPYVGSRRVDFIKLLRRFIDVCNAIAYGHSRGIIHRDIKPANVMLGKFGETFVVDWGLAKKMSDSDEHADPDESKIEPASGSGSNPTTMGSTVGTPAFMPPEQAEGQLDDLGATSDVYSLGATFYFLLTHHAPVSGEHASELLEKVRKGDIRLPREVNPHTPPALQAICLHAMALAPEDRYQTPQQLADDIENWIADEPVSVHAESIPQRFGRWLRRHRSWALATAVSLIIIAVISSLAAVSINRAKNDEIRQRELAQDAQEEEARQRNLAENRRLEALDNFRQARGAVDTSLTGISKVLKYYPGVQQMRQGLLEKAAADYELFASQKSDDLEIQLERGRAYLRLGDIRRSLNQAAEAEKAYQQAVSVFTKLKTQAAKGPDAPRGLAISKIKLGILYDELGDPDKSSEIYQETIKQLREMKKQWPDDESLLKTLASALSNSASLHAKRGQNREARAKVLESLELFKEIQSASSRDPEMAIERANALNLAGIIHFQEGQVEKAGDTFREGVSQFDQLLKSDKENPDYLQSRAALLISLAITSKELGDTRAELKSYQQALESYQVLATAIPDVPIFQENQAVAQADLGQLYFEIHDLDAATRILSEATRSFTKLFQLAPDIDRFRERLGASSEMIGRCYLHLGQLDQARQFIGNAVELLEQLAQDNTDQVLVLYTERLAIARRHLADVSAAEGKLADALVLVDVSLTELAELIDRASDIPRFRSGHAGALARKGELLTSLDREEEALACWQEAREQWEGVLLDSPVANQQFQLARLIVHHPLLQNPGTLARALELAGSCVEQVPANARYQNLLSHAQLLSGSLEDADRSLAAARQARQHPSGLDDLVGSLIASARDDQPAAVKHAEAARSWLSDMQPGNPRMKWLLGQFLPESP
jgi:serine/threonine-protein kinase